MERKGACKRCGKCCQAKFLLNSMNWVEKIIVRIAVILKGKKLDKNTSKCKSLYFKKGKAICKRYDRRPNFCKAFPDAPTNIDGCGFYFSKGE